jgi:predicted helicase
LSRKEGGKVFGAGSRNTVAVFVGVKGADRSGPCGGDSLIRDQCDGLIRTHPGFGVAS